MLSEHLKLIENAAKECGISDSVVEYDTGSGNGGHFLGVITPVTVKSKDDDEKVSFILKTAQIDDEVRRKRAVIAAFEREFEFYDRVLPRLLTFQATNSLTSPFTGIPKYYGGISDVKKEAILIENLKFIGYKLWNCMEPMDFDHMALVFKEYARFHVISLALRHKHPAKFEDLAKNIKLNFLQQREAENPEHYVKLRATILGMGNKAVRGNRKAEEGYRKFEEGYPVFRKRDQEHPEEQVLVISHGDCHANNMLFKYQNTTETPISKPEKVCFIDWQLSCTESPMHDLVFALGVCASKQVLQRSEELFQMYCAVVTRSLQEFGCEPEKVFTTNIFKEQWKKHISHGLYRAQTNLKLTLMTEQEFAELGESTSILDTLRKDFSLNSKFAHRMKDLYEVVGELWL